MKRSSNCHRSRCGSLIVESVIVIALLATAFVALGNLATSSSAISQNADQRLAATLAAENMLQRLQAVSFDSVIEQSPAVAKLIQNSSGYELQVKAEEFRAGDRDAIHLIVTVAASETVSVTLHDWRFARPAVKPGDDDA